MQTISALLLDFDGTLADSLSVMKTSYANFLNAHQLSSDKLSFSELNGPPLIEVVAKIKKTYALQISEKILLEQYREVINQQYHTVLPSAGSIALLASALKNKIKVIIVTSNLKSIVNNWLVKHGLTKLVYDVVGAEDIKLGKPNPEPYLLALERAQCNNMHAIAVEDSYIGALSAFNANLKTFCIASEEVKDHPLAQSVIFIKNLTELLPLMEGKYGYSQGAQLC